MNQADLIEFKKIQWVNSANALDRIKGEEQKWLFYAFATFGAFFSLYLGGENIHTNKLFIKYPFISFNVISGALEVFVIFWVGQALAYRQQYYTSMTRLFDAQIVLGEKLPASWSNTRIQIVNRKSKLGRLLYDWSICVEARMLWFKKEDIDRMKSNDAPCTKGELHRHAILANLWRERATGPKGSKLFEILMIMFLFCLSIISVAMNLPVRIEDNYALQLTLFLYLGISFIIWPFIVYPVLDRLKLRKIYLGSVMKYQLLEGDI